MQSYSSPLLLKQAFAPARVKHNPGDLLNTIYSKEPPYYAEHGPDTVPESKPDGQSGPKYTEQELDIVTKFNQQFYWLINAILRFEQKFQFTAQQIENLLSFSRHIRMRDYYERQPASFYVTVKKDLEIILLAIADEDPIAIRDNKQPMHQLLNEIDTCGPGCAGHILIAKNAVTNEISIETWLAKLRETIINQLASLHVQTKNISINNQIHVYNVLFSYACTQKWNPLGFQSNGAINEIHYEIAEVNNADYEVFSRNFFERYNPMSIMTCITETMHEMFSARILKGIKESPKGMVFRGIKEFSNFFVGLPLVEKAGIIDVLFKLYNDEEKSDAVSSSLIFKFGNLRYQLKPINELRLSLTRFYLTPESDRLFPGYFQEINESFSYGIVTGTAALCYLYSTNDDTICQLNSVAAPIDLIIFKEQGIPLKQASFAGYLKSGCSDFTDCILENVDLSNIDIELCIFKRAIFKDVVVTGPQFLYLFICKIDFQQSNFKIDYTTHTTTLIECIRQPGYFEYLAREIKASIDELLFFSAYTLDDGEFIAKLMASGADLRKKHKGLTAIQVAANRNHWTVVGAIATNTSKLFNKNDQYNFGYALELVTKANDTTLATILLSANAIPDDKWASLPAKNTSLHWAAQNNNSELLVPLFQANANPAAVNNDGLTPIQVAVKRGHWSFIEAFVSLKSENGEYRYGYVLLFSILQGQTTTALALLAAKAQTGWHIGTNRSNCLHLAFEMNMPELVGLLVKTDRSLINIENSAHLRPIQIGLVSRQWSCIEMFARNITPNNNLHDRYHLGPILVIAAKEKIPLIVIALTRLNADINACTEEDKNTALHWAIINKSYLEISELVLAGANLNALNSENKTPLALAEESDAEQKKAHRFNFFTKWIKITDVINQASAMKYALPPKSPTISLKYASQ